MIRILAYLMLICAIALGAGWLFQWPGRIEFTWLGYRVTMSALVGLAVVVLPAVALLIVLSLFRFIFGRQRRSLGTKKS